MKNAVYGQKIPVQRMTKTAALLLATVLAVPVFLILSVIDWLWL